MNYRIFSRYLVCAATAALMTPCVSQADVRLPKVISSHMVLQQEKPITLWGWANAGEAVSVTLGENTQQTKATNKGEWRVTLPAMKATDKPLTLTVKGNNTVTAEDILVGEVWLCSGQSNMEMGIKQVLNADKEIAEANYPSIRLFMVPKAVSIVPLADIQAKVPGTSEWKTCTPENVAVAGWGGFSAAGYFFGREIHKTLNVPVGLIESAWGGTRIEPWTPPVGFAQVPELKSIYDTVQLNDPTSDEHKKKIDELVAATEKWIAAARKARDEETIVPQQPDFPKEFMPLTSQQQPMGLFNAMISPIVPISLRGVIWYQGEANCSEGSAYIDKTKAQVLGWRKVFNQPDLPYYYTQIAPWPYGNQNPHVLPTFWEAQSGIMNAVPNTGMVVTSDIGDVKDIHPKNKQEVGRRLALWALAKTYGKSDVVYSGPVFKSLKTEGDKLRVTFDSTAGGLISRDGKPLTHFEIIDSDKGGFVPAQATIDGDSVVLSAANVSKPVAMRYGWHKLAEPNLSNKAGLPASAFRAGDVPNRDALVMNIDEAKDYELIYDLDLAKLGASIKYDVDNSGKITKPFDRIAYFLELTDANGQQQYIYISTDAFTADITRIGIPTVASGAKFQTKISNMNVTSNVSGIVNGTGLKGGNIEFWPNNYAGNNGANIPNANGQTYDFGDQIDTSKVDGYGSMQIHNYEAKQVLLAINNWKSGGNADIGIGNNTTIRGNNMINPDWTFSGNASSWQAKRLRVLVHLK